MGETNIKSLRTLTKRDSHEVGVIWINDNGKVGSEPRKTLEAVKWTPSKRPACRAARMLKAMFEDSS